ncbi:MAG: hypothetical protein QM764_21810 [Chitinophagaceae bacterium]
MTSQSMGYNMDQLMVLRKPVLSNPGTNFINTAEGFINTIQQLAAVKGAAVSARIPGDELGNVNNIMRLDIASDNSSAMATMGIDERFIALYQMKLLAGRNFSALDYDSLPPTCVL